jgi:hypothetical protein
MRQPRISWVVLSITLTFCASSSTATGYENRPGHFQPSMGTPSPNLASSLGRVPLGSTDTNPRFISKTLRFRPLTFFPSPFGLVGTPQTSITIVVVPPAVDQQEPPVDSESASVKSQPLFIIQRCGEFVRVPPAEAMRGAEESCP